MSCPDWTTLTAHRRSDERAPAAEPAGWADAMAHLDRCADCRPAAVAADPTLVFRRLGTVEPGSDEIADMRAGVAALRRAGRVAEAPGSARGPASRRATGGGSTWWARAAAAAILAAGLLSLQPGLDEPLSERSDASRAAAGTLGLQGLPPIAWLDDAGASAVDDIESPSASVYHFDDEELAVVMVVDAGLDV